MKIVFFGTSDFAVPSLKSLHESFEIAAVVTAPDKRGGRGRKQLIASPVKLHSQSKGLHVIQPTNLKSSEFISQLEEIKAELFVVVAFRMLPKIVWDMPEFGTVNLHASLLPAYRGAAPINHAIIQGEEITGMTVFKLDEKIDTGDLLCKEKVEIYPQETAGELHDRMAVKGGSFLVNCLEKYISGDIVPLKQAHEKASHAPKLDKGFCKLDFTLPAKNVFNKIRGLCPYPGAFINIDGLEFKIFTAQIRGNIEGAVIQRPGQILSDGKSFLAIAANDKWIECMEVQLQGKRRMMIGNFLNGYGQILPNFAN